MAVVVVNLSGCGWSEEWLCLIWGERERERERDEWREKSNREGQRENGETNGG